MRNIVKLAVRLLNDEPQHWSGGGDRLFSIKHRSGLVVSAEYCDWFVQGWALGFFEERAVTKAVAAMECRRFEIEARNMTEADADKALADR